MRNSAATLAAVSLSSILPIAEVKAASKAKKIQDGIYIYGGNVNLTGKTYSLEFIQPVKLAAYVDGKMQSEGTWRSQNKHLVSVDSDGTIIMRDGTSGHSVDVTWTLGDKSFKVTFLTRQTIGAQCITTDSPLTRGQFMIMLSDHFGWSHYNSVMDDGTDIDENGEIMETERVRNFYDVTGVADYVKPIESALDMGVLSASSADQRFYPMATMTREDAAVILKKAFLIEDLGTDYIKGFSDADKVNKEAYAALNALIGKNYMHGLTESELGPAEGISASEARITIDNISRRRVSPVWAMPVSHRKFVRCRPIWKCPTDGVTVHWRTRAFNISHKEIEGMFIQDRGVGVKLEGAWGPWYDYKPGYSTDPMFGLNNTKDLPYDRIWFCVEVEAYATKPGMEDGPVSKFVWRIDRPAWHDFAFDVLHEGNDNFPTIYRFFDNFQAAAYYIQGSKFGIIYDGLMPTNTTISLYDKVKELATTDFCFVLGHEHGDHNGAMPYVYEKGKKVYLCKKVGSKGKAWSITTYNEDFTSSNRSIKDTRKGEYGENAIEIDEGYVFDLGNCKFKTYRLPGHENASMILHDAEHGLIFASDIYGVNRYWTADQFSARGVKQDLLLSLQQQLMVEYRKNGGLIKEVYTGHNRSGVGSEYLMVWENCLQKLIDYGSDGVEDDRRGDGAILAKDGDSLGTLIWTAFAQGGKMMYVEYEGKYDKKPFHRIEVDNTGENPSVDSNLYFERSKNSSLSNIVIIGGDLVGHDFLFRTGFDDAKATMPDGSGYKYVIENKFVPYEYDYEVIVKDNASEIKIAPVATSNLIKGITVNGQAASSRCPVSVPTSRPCTIVVTAPDGVTKSTYTLKFKK
ncbi:MAG: cadherin-like beta sandwich domain-containing protein [Bacteroidales bacterium]|nr:cadherin-like beta sandwich domain-containing protein [Bacteroidales bacterium]